MFKDMATLKQNDEVAEFLSVERMLVPALRRLLP
jgi:hypothetical protein